MSTDTFIESRTYDQGFTVEIHYDVDPMSPREWDNATCMVLSHRRYNLPNDAGIRFDDFGSWKEVAAELRRNHGALRLLPVYMIDHSGVALSTRDFSNVDPGGWDSGVLGLAYVTAESWKLCMGGSYNARSSKDRKLADEVIASDVEVYGQYLNGEVYGYVVKSPSGQALDSCWGMMGYDSWDDIYAQAQAEIDYHIENQSRLLVFS